MIKIIQIQNIFKKSEGENNEEYDNHNAKTIPVSVAYESEKENEEKEGGKRDRLPEKEMKEG